MFRNSAPSAHFPNTVLTMLTHNVGIARRQVGTARQNAQISILTRRNPSSFIEDIQTILPLFQGNIRCLLPAVVAEYLYL